MSIHFCASLHRSAGANADMLKYAGRRPAMKRPHCSAMLGKIKNCVLTSSEAQPNATDDKIHMFKFKLAERRPTMKRIHCSAMLVKAKICELASSSSLHRTIKNTIDILK